MFVLADLDPPKWTDVWSAVGTAGAAVLALIAIGVTIWLAARDRKKAERQRQADGEEAVRLRQEDLARAAAQRTEDLARAAQDRAEADQRLLDERAAADQRLERERADWDRRQKQDRQHAAAGSLLARIAQLQPYIPFLTQIPYELGSRDYVWRSHQEAIRVLQDGAYSDALALGHPVALKLYRNLVSLVVSAGPALERLERDGVVSAELDEFGQHQPSNLEETMILTIRHYARFVRLNLAHLIETGDVLQEADREAAPVFGRTAFVAWLPVNIPADWHDDADTDPDDPQFRARP